MRIIVWDPLTKDENNPVRGLWAYPMAFRLL